MYQYYIAIDTETLDPKITISAFRMSACLLGRDMSKYQIIKVKQYSAQLVEFPPLECNAVQRTLEQA